MRNFWRVPTAYWKLCHYAKIQREIEGFVANKEAYSYSRLGVILCLLHIPYKFENRYFCSQFVAETLMKSGAIELKKKESLYLPGHFLEDLEDIFSKRQLAYNAL